MISETLHIRNLKINYLPLKFFHSITKSYSKEALKLTCGSFYLPKHNEDGPLSDEAHFICTEKNTIGVADGVGGSRELMANRVVSLNHKIKGSINPGGVLLSAYKKTWAKEPLNALVIALNKNKRLKYANSGDCGLMVFRENKLLHESPFSLPRDTRNVAYVEEIKVKEGDIVVATTGGLLDNVCTLEIEAILNRNEAGEFNGEKLAAEIVECALCNSVNEDYFSPFAKAPQQPGFKCIGGKYDDITVVVAKIQLDL